MSNFSSVFAVVHEQQAQISDVVNAELEESVGQQVTSLVVASISDLDHLDVAFEATADTRIDTARAAPGFTQTLQEIGMMAKERLGSLLDDLWLGQGGNHSKY